MLPVILLLILITESTVSTARTKGHLTQVEEPSNQLSDTEFAFSNQSTDLDVDEDDMFKKISPQTVISTQCANDSFCGGIVEAREKLQFLNSSGSFSKYDNRRNCIWTIIAPPGQIIDMYLWDSKCHLEKYYDTMRIYDGPDLNSPLLYECTGNLTSVSRWWTSSNVASVHFVTDDSIAEEGFKLVYSSVDLVPCGGLHTNATGEIAYGSQPITPIPIPNECVWGIKVPNATMIAIKFKAFQGVSALSITDLMSNPPTTLTYSGHNIPKKYISTSNELLIRIRNQQKNAGFRFQMNYISYMD